jgi:FtsP/CotA-like multicopper oxidase with cupredoxin domain
MRGLQDRTSGVIDSTELAPGTTHEFRFRATVVGAWYYWAGSASARVPSSGVDGQLVGALVVDSASASSSHTMDDRVFVMTRWTPGGTMGNRGFQVNAFNGRSWPHTERLTYTMGDSVRWHVINASDELHMMHLHGFYYRVEARGDAAHDSALVRARPPTVVTTATRQGEWMSMVWSPERAGNWLFHCHFVSHMSADQRLDRMPGARTTTTTAPHEHATESMAGLLLGITVRPAPTAVASSRMPTEPKARVVHVFADARARVFDAKPGLGFVIQEGLHQPARDSIRTPSAPLLLTRGEPASIVVHNRLDFPIAVHWHGIELESYFDGVGGWSGMGRRLAPMIAPQDSFIARMTPPRAGTFMYHVHNEHGDELASGLYAPLLVLEPGEPFDERTERVFTIATAVVASGRGEDAPPFVNGSASADTMLLVSGTTYRFRILDISSNEAHVVSLAGPAGLETWRAIARDGRTLAANLAMRVSAREITAAGVTRDFGFTPTVAGDYTLTIATLLETRLTGQRTVVPIRVRSP